ncbi:MAG: hypothetical protein MUF81_01190 [Verrucomicrobia bacterium]|nr:hypothetical protein [Verrucomicrobiota bacterium]
MKIRLRNQTFPPDVAATAQYLTDLALALTARGHQVTMVTAAIEVVGGPNGCTKYPRLSTGKRGGGSRQRSSWATSLSFI